MKIQLVSYKKTYTVETDYDDLTVSDYFEIFENLLVQATFSQKSVREFIIERAEELKDLEYFESKQKNDYKLCIGLIQKN